MREHGRGVFALVDERLQRELLGSFQVRRGRDRNGLHNGGGVSHGGFRSGRKSSGRPADAAQRPTEQTFRASPGSPPWCFPWWRGPPRGRGERSHKSTAPERM